MLMHVQGTAAFAGTVSSVLADPSSRLQRSGFCGINLDVSFPSQLGRGVHHQPSLMH